MEGVVGVEGKVETEIEECVLVKSSSAPSSPNGIAHPVVYKLVRVEGNGRLVPATDDEIMEVEGLLEDDKNEMHYVAHTEQTLECTTYDEFSSALSHFKGSEDSIDADAEILNASLDAAVDLVKSDAIVEDIAPSSAPSSNDSHFECSNSRGGSVKSGVSTANVSTSSRPDFSMLKGEICLDKLSVKELHETFKATFGRETSVKDKQWLKRRIAMALGNSCDISCTSFVITDGKVVKKEEVICRTNDKSEGSPIYKGDKNEDLLNSSVKRSSSPILEDNFAGEEVQMEHGAAKRVRKPTKRYIEELSDVEYRECSGKSFSAVKNSRHGQSDLKPCVRTVQNTRSDGRPLVTTRLDSLGGSGVQVPYVSRVRRSRPRENFMDLTKLQPCGLGIATMVKKTVIVPAPPSDEEGKNKTLKTELTSGWIEQPIFAETEKCNEYLVSKTSETDETEELKFVDSPRDNSDKNEINVATAKGGMRRKHHRPWTPSEVVKLVEGVARYGAGRWSEIKRVAFASHSYRTSVDLKDKWRNLLRASFADLPAGKGINNSRKNASAPIPSQILSRVRELAELQAQVPPDLSSTKFAGQGIITSSHETRPGYL